MQYITSFILQWHSEFFKSVLNYIDFCHHFACIEVFVKPVVNFINEAVTLIVDM